MQYFAQGRYDNRYDIARYSVSPATKRRERSGGRGLRPFMWPSMARPMSYRLSCTRRVRRRLRRHVSPNRRMSRGRPARLANHMHSDNLWGPRGGLHFCRDFAMFCEDICRAFTPALHPRLFRPAQKQTPDESVVTTSGLVNGGSERHDLLGLDLSCNGRDARCPSQCAGDRPSTDSISFQKCHHFKAHLGVPIRLRVLTVFQNQRDGFAATSPRPIWPPSYKKLQS